MHLYCICREVYKQKQKYKVSIYLFGFCFQRHAFQKTTIKKEMDGSKTIFYSHYKSIISERKTLTTSKKFEKKHFFCVPATVTHIKCSALSYSCKSSHNERNPLSCTVDIDVVVEVVVDAPLLLVLLFL